MAQTQPAEHASKVELAVVWTLRAVVVISGLIDIIGGDVGYGVFCMIGVAVISLPQIIAHSKHATLPPELDVVLLVLLVLDTTVGRQLGVYELIPWYDKALHFGASFALAMMAFLFVYMLHFTGHTRRHAVIDAIMIFLLTAGLGALWEICEYGADQLLGRATQGSPQLAPFADTMVDLMLDASGGLIAAIAGTLWMKYSKRSRARMDRYANLLEKHAPEKAKRLQETRGPHHAAKAA